METIKKLVGMQGNICFEPVNMTREKTRSLEDDLAMFYGDGSISILGIPASLPLEIPRMVFQSANNHSSIQISGVNGQLTVSFDDNFSENFDECFSYCKERMNLLRNALIKVGVNIKFSGITTQFVCTGELCVINNLRKKAFKLNEKYEVFDVLGRVTYVKNGIFYLNLTMNNLRDSSNQEAVGISLDVNDRYIDNFPKKVGHDPNKTLNELFDMQKNFAENTLNDLLCKGVFSDAI